MNIGIDIDDTLTELLHIKIKTANEYILKNNINAHLVRTDTSEFSEMYSWDTETFEKFWFSEMYSVLANVDVRPDAVRVINNLKKQGHKIYIITARTTESHKDPFKLSYEWLVKNKILFDELHVEHSDKLQICIDKKIDIFIDDLPNTIERLSNSNIRTIIMDASHNQNMTIPKNCTRVYGWEGVEEKICGTK